MRAITILQVLRRYLLQGAIDPARAREAIADLVDLPLVRYPHDPLLFDAFALYENLTAYEAVYAALAEALDAMLLTRDASLAGVPVIRERVEQV